ncbi:hypothetical protein MKX01_007152 [Papaver californicum]|nr:hypothetical protein MKX01_007152 [Papaver californicum]
MANKISFHGEICELAEKKKKIINSYSQDKDLELSLLGIYTRVLAQKVNRLTGIDTTKAIGELEKAIDCEVNREFSEHMKKIVVLDDAEVCSVCLQDIDVGDDDVVVLKCNSHTFHKKCMQEWSKKQPNCPLCRHDMRKDLTKKLKRKRSHDNGEHKGEASIHLRQKT